MANDYTGVSFIAAMDILPEEAVWWKQNSDFQTIEEAGFPHPFEDECVGFDLAIDDDAVIVFSHGNADLEQIAIVCQRFLQKFRPQESIEFTYACWSDKPRVGAFCGGSVRITASNIEW